MNDVQRPLTGVKVIDFTQVMLGPIATQVLGDYGADVVKIEKQSIGDLTRWSVTGNPADIENPLFGSMNRNKRSIALDLKSHTARQVIEDLIRHADVVVSNFRAGVMERFGFGYERCRALNESIIYASGSGFGDNGPLSHKGGQDILAQALSGVMKRRSDDREPLSIYATCLCDYTAGMHLVQAILMALIQRRKTGLGQEVSVSLFQSMLAMQSQEAAMWLQRNEDLNYRAGPFAGAYATTDGYIVLGDDCATDRLELIAAAIDYPGLSNDPRFHGRQAQAENRRELTLLIADKLAANTTHFWLERLETHGISCAPVLTMDEALRHPQTAANDSLVRSASGAGESVGSPLKLSDSPFVVQRRPPGLGADGRRILAELRYSDEEIEELVRSGAVAF